MGSQNSLDPPRTERQAEEKLHQGHRKPRLLTAGPPGRNTYDQPPHPLGKRGAQLEICRAWNKEVQGLEVAVAGAGRTDGRACALPPSSLGSGDLLAPTLGS